MLFVFVKFSFDYSRLVCHKIFKPEAYTFNTANYYKQIFLEHSTEWVAFFKTYDKYIIDNNLLMWGKIIFYGVIIWDLIVEVSQSLWNRFLKIMGH